MIKQTLQGLSKFGEYSAILKIHVIGIIIVVKYESLFVRQSSYSLPAMEGRRKVLRARAYRYLLTLYY